MILLRKASMPAMLAAALALGAMGDGAQAKGRGHRPPAPGQFDYYVLSLSWVPGFCATKSDPAECNKGLTFALHGLWPQFNGGGYPSNCSKAALSAADVQTYQGIYADPALIRHEWAKHGTCSGLAPGAYFTLSSADAKAVRLPAAYGPKARVTAAQAQAVKAAFVSANPGLPADGIATVTAQGVLTEVDICLTKAGAFQSCR